MSRPVTIEELRRVLRVIYDSAADAAATGARHDRSLFADDVGRALAALPAEQGRCVGCGHGSHVNKRCAECAKWCVMLPAEQEPVTVAAVERRELRELAWEQAGRTWAALSAKDLWRERAHQAEAERDAYRRAKHENDDRFMQERDAAIARAEQAERERDEARALAWEQAERTDYCHRLAAWWKRDSEREANAARHCRQRAEQAERERDDAQHDACNQAQRADKAEAERDALRAQIDQAQQHGPVGQQVCRYCSRSYDPSKDATRECWHGLASLYCVPAASAAPVPAADVAQQIAAAEQSQPAAAEPSSAVPELPPLRVISPLTWGHYNELRDAAESLRERLVEALRELDEESREHAATVNQQFRLYGELNDAADQRRELRELAWEQAERACQANDLAAVWENTTTLALRGRDAAIARAEQAERERDEARKAAFQADSFSVAAQRRRAEIDRADKAEAERDALRAQIADAEQRGRAQAFEDVAAECEQRLAEAERSGVYWSGYPSLSVWCRKRAEEARG